MEKRLFRSRENRVIAGVCGGVGEYFNIDPTSCKINLLAFSILGGLSAWIYLLALIIMPNEPNIQEGGVTLKKLYRSRKDAMVAGVCGGLAEYIGVDSAIVRLVFAVAVVMGGIGVLAYFAWIIIPEGSNSGEFEYDNSETKHHMELSGDRLRMVIGCLVLWVLVCLY